MKSRASFSKLMKPDHLKAIRALGYTLTLGDEKSWWGIVPIFMARLTLAERATLAFIATSTLDEDTGLMIAEAALSRGRGDPLPPLLDPLGEASSWVAFASPEELDAYAVAIFNAMPPPKKRAFLDFAGRDAA